MHPIFYKLDELLNTSNFLRDPSSHDFGTCRARYKTGLKRGSTCITPVKVLEGEETLKRAETLSAYLLSLTEIEDEQSVVQFVEELTQLVLCGNHRRHKQVWQRLLDWEKEVIETIEQHNDERLHIPDQTLEHSRSLADLQRTRRNSVESERRINTKTDSPIDTEYGTEDTELRVEQCYDSAVGLVNGLAGLAIHDRNLCTASADSDDDDYSSGDSSWHDASSFIAASDDGLTPDSTITSMPDDLDKSVDTTRASNLGYFSGIQRGNFTGHITDSDDSEDANSFSYWDDTNSSSVAVEEERASGTSVINQENSAKTVAKVQESVPARVISLTTDDIAAGISSVTEQLRRATLGLSDLEPISSGARVRDRTNASNGDPETDTHHSSAEGHSATAGVREILGAQVEPYYKNKIHDESGLLESFHRELGQKDRKVGIVYCCKHADHKRLFKIGFTESCAETRKYDRGNCYGEDTVIIYQRHESYLGAYRVETLVHQALRQERLKMAEGCAKCGARHKEWFLGDEEVILQTLKAIEALVALPAYVLDEGRYRLTNEALKILKVAFSFKLDRLQRELDRRGRLNL